jgi:hypothetical protein
MWRPAYRSAKTVTLREEMGQAVRRLRLSIESKRLSNGHYGRYPNNNGVSQGDATAEWQILLFVQPNR